MNIKQIKFTERSTGNAVVDIVADKNQDIREFMQRLKKELERSAQEINVSVKKQ
jgi:hypothetical protein